MRRILLLLVSLSMTAGSAAAGPAAPPAHWPTGAPASVVRTFDPPAKPWLAGHRGVDLLVVPGQEVRSPLPGVVVLARRVVDRPVIVVQSGALRVSLEPVDATVAVGTAVAAGQPIGTVANGRGHCPPRHCLHWGVRVDGVYHDPLLLVRHYRPVLLPDA